MSKSKESVSLYIKFFFKNIVGFKDEKPNYIQLQGAENKYISILMDSIKRIERPGGKLRDRIWSTFIFTFHNGFSPDFDIKKEVEKYKNTHTYLFLRSYVYFVYIDLSKGGRQTFFGTDSTIKTSNYKIWYFNSKYEISEATARQNLLNIKLHDETIDELMYFPDVRNEIKKIQESNDDTVSFIQAFTKAKSFEYLGQTMESIEEIDDILENNKQGARILVSGPARSGKTIVAATFLGKYKDSKMLLMNYHFYERIVDGLEALNIFSEEERRALVSDAELDAFLGSLMKIKFTLRLIVGNLDYIIKNNQYHFSLFGNNKTKEFLIENIEIILEHLSKHGFKYEEYTIFNQLDKFLRLIKEGREFTEEQIKKLKTIIENFKKQITSGGNVSKAAEQFTERVNNMLNELVEKSSQKIFHHDLTRKPERVRSGCWVELDRDSDGWVPKMWSINKKPFLIICDEAQRLGEIGGFDEQTEIVINSSNTLFVGDNYQQLNYRYDMGITELKNKIEENGEELIEHKLSDSLGIPDYIARLIKYLVFPESVSNLEVLNSWGAETSYKIILIKGNATKLVNLFDKDPMNKKHFAIPSDSLWMNKTEVKERRLRRGDELIVPLIEKEGGGKDFIYRFPFFCNEQIMPKFLLSAYELISREVDSLYVHIPKFKKETNFQWGKEARLYNDLDVWFRRHLYVLFTRPTQKLIINIEIEEIFQDFKARIEQLKRMNIKIPIEYIE